MAVGARSGHGEPEKRPERPVPSAAAMTDDATGHPDPDPRSAQRPVDHPGQGSEQRADQGAMPGSGPAGGPAGGPTGGPAGGRDGDGGFQDGDGDDSGGDEGSSGRGGRAPKKPRSFWKELPLLIGIALVLALLIKTFLVQAFSIPSDSMMNTLQRGDRVLVDKLTPWFGSEPERGEVVVFHDPGGWLEDGNTPEPNALQTVLSWIGLMPSAEEKDLIKRVIAIGGDTVSCKEGGKVVVNGKELDESAYLHPGSVPCDPAFGPVKVPEGRIWVMGDNRQNSLDSRFHMELAGGGTVSNDEVVGRAVVIAWPVTRWATLPVPETFDQPGLSQALAVAPGALGFAGALPLVLWRRRKLSAPVGAASAHTAR
ncbi:signal peptidase I [Streptomyces sp. NPDC101115]|uniref:signal peptidase I n=1 Tax=Streptomyces sp. NPDC101115 TaxID=3366106 RepID=UPI003823EA71